MSRIGMMPIKLPAGTSAQIGKGDVTVKGPKGSLVSPISPGITVKQEGDVLTLERAGDSKQMRAHHGLCRSLLANAVTGVSKGFKKELDIQGIGFRANVVGNQVEFQLGYSHPILLPIPEGINITIEKGNAITIEGIDKQMVGQIAAEIRAFRPPDVYSGKGIRYKGEVVRRKVGKAAIGVT
jgi:large subunit ribosomal protein L6